MHEWTSLIDKLALLLASLTGLITAFVSLGKTVLGKSKEKPPDEKVKDTEEDAELYRKRWLEAEKGYDELEDENRKLKEKVKQLENQIIKLKKNIRGIKNEKLSKRKNS